MSEQEPKAKTFEDLKAEYEEAEWGSPEEAAALDQMAETASTKEQWEIVYEYSDSGSELEARAEAELAKFDQ